MLTPTDKLPGDMEWTGAPDLKPTLRPIEDLILLPGNPRRGDVDAVAKSLQRFGQRKPIVVNADGVIIAGNHTYQAVLQNGWSHVAVIDASDLDGREQRAYSLADNRLSDLAEYDQEGLLAMLEEAATTAGGLEGLGFDDADVEVLERLTEAYGGSPTNPEDEWVGMPEFEQGDLQSAFRVTIHFPTDDAADAFFNLIGIKRRRSSQPKPIWWPESDGHVAMDSAKVYVSDDSE